MPIESNANLKKQTMGRMVLHESNNQKPKIKKNKMQLDLQNLYENKKPMPLMQVPNGLKKMPELRAERR
jgi:predicted HAD superfamily phosphohydrolase YqeG